MKNLYRYSFPIRLLFALQVLLGIVLFYVVIILIIEGVDLKQNIIIIPLLSAGLVINGLFSKKITEININGIENRLEIRKISLFINHENYIDLNYLAVELKTANKRKHYNLFPRLRLIILLADKEVEEMKSLPLALNNERIRKLYSDLKKLAIATNSNFPIRY